MPGFSIDIEFEVYCKCGAHMCGETETRKSRNRDINQAVINPCQDCIDKAKLPLEDYIEELKEKIKDLKQLTNR